MIKGSNQMCVCNQAASLLMCVFLLFATSLNGSESNIEAKADIKSENNQLLALVGQLQAGEIGKADFGGQLSLMTKDMNAPQKKEFMARAYDLVNREKVNDADPYLKDLEIRTAIAFYDLSMVDVSEAPTTKEQKEAMRKLETVRYDRYSLLLNSIQERIRLNSNVGLPVHDSSAPAFNEKGEIVTPDKTTDATKKNEEIIVARKQVSALKGQERLLLPLVQSQADFIVALGGDKVTYDRERWQLLKSAKPKEDQNK